MATARRVKVQDIIDACNYELRNTSTRQYIDEELIAYINRSLELIYSILMAEKSPLIRTGSGSITTVAGTCEYSLEDNDMDDLWEVHRIWTPGSDPLELTTEEDKYEYETAEDDGDTGSRTEPTHYYLTADKIGLLPYPDGEYSYTVRYYPNYVPVQDTDDLMPLKNLFNQQVIEATKLLAKNREGTPMNVEAAMLEIFQDRALAISRSREGRSVGITIRRS